MCVCVHTSMLHYDRQSFAAIKIKVFNHKMLCIKSRKEGLEDQKLINSVAMLYNYSQEKLIKLEIQLYI